MISRPPLSRILLALVAGQPDLAMAVDVHNLKFDHVFGTNPAIEPRQRKLTGG